MTGNSSSNAEYDYPGGELELFSTALNWKSYLRKQLSRTIGANVLEVGAGIGATTHALCTSTVDRWVCLEPDSRLASRIRSELDSGELPSCCEIASGTLRDLKRDDRFDTILYVDVLEHIEDDQAELQSAAEFLAPGGNLVVLAPAHQWLYTPFDEAIGHFRRYTKKALAALTPEGLTMKRLAYLDTVGLAASAGNRLLLKQRHPTPRQIKIWDRIMVPLSRRIDPILGYRFGKSVLAIWTRNAVSIP